MTDIVPARETLPADPPEEVRELRARIARMEAAVLEQNALLRQLLDAVGSQRLTRAQERTITGAIHARARRLAEREGLPAAARRRVASEIRKTIRQATGCRAVGDIPARHFDKTLAAVNAWDMAGALRRIRKEL